MPCRQAEWAPKVLEAERLPASRSISSHRAVRWHGSQRGGSVAALSQRHLDAGEPAIPGAGCHGGFADYRRGGRTGRNGEPVAGRAACATPADADHASRCVEGWARSANGRQRLSALLEGRQLRSRRRRTRDSSCSLRRPHRPYYRHRPGGCVSSADDPRLRPQRRTADTERRPGASRGTTAQLQAREITSCAWSSSSLAKIAAARAVIGKIEAARMVGHLAAAA